MLVDQPKPASIDAASFVKLVDGELHIVAAWRTDESKRTGELAQRADHDFLVGDALHILGKSRPRTNAREAGRHQTECAFKNGAPVDEVFLDHGVPIRLTNGICRPGIL